MNLIKEINRKSSQERALSAIRSIPSLVTFHTQQGISIVPWKNIMYCRADSNYTHVYLMDGRHLVVSKTLNDVLSKLPSAPFFRTHKSVLVNLNAITEINTATVQIPNEILLPVARGKRKPLLEKIYQISIKI